MNTLTKKQQDLRDTKILQKGITLGKAQAKEEILKEIEKHIIDDDYMSIDTKQSLKELKDKIK